MERLDWEIGTPEIPREIRTTLAIVRDIVVLLNWTNKDQFEQARDTWTPIRDWIKQKIDETQVLREAVDYYLEMNSAISPYWNLFLYRKPSLI